MPKPITRLRSRSHRAILLGSTLSLAPALCDAALADPVAAPAAAEPTQIVITGDAASNTKTIADKRVLNIVSDGISATQVGELPEFGLGEALSSIPGVSFVLNNGRGEDQFMTIRGLNPDYNSTTVDGMVLPSTEEFVRSLSFDVLPSIVVSQADVLKTWTVDQPTDAVGGVTALKTRSAFDHPGFYIAGHLDNGYWDDRWTDGAYRPSGQGDLVISKTFGPNNQFGILLLGSYFLRSSGTTNTTTSGNSYYPSASVGQNGVYALDQSSPTASSSTLKPADNVSGFIPVPETRGIYQYNDTRTRPTGFARLDFNDHNQWHAHLTGAYSNYLLREDRWFQFASAVGPANLLTSTSGSYAKGLAQTQYDNYHILREIGYVDTGVGVDFSAKSHLDFTFNYAVSHYQQDGHDFTFNQAANSGLAFNYDLTAKPGPYYNFATSANYLDPTLYKFTSTLYEIDRAKTRLPQAKLEFSHNFAATDSGFGFDTGVLWRDLKQAYSYTQARLNANAATAPTLDLTGNLGSSFVPYSNQGLGMLRIDPQQNTNYVNSNPTLFTANASDTLINTINNFTLDERIISAYTQFDYRADNLFVVAGVKYESTNQSISNYLPNPFGSQTSFVQTVTPQNYDRLLPSLNVTYNPIKTVALRGAITQTLARPEYSQLGENSSATVSGATATETIANPNLKPRESTNYDLSLEYYPKPGALISVALFDKHIRNEIITLTSTQQGVTIPGYATTVALTTTTPENVGSASVRGIELNLVNSSFDFLPGAFLKRFGARANATFIAFDAPNIRMADGSFRRLPQLVSSTKDVESAAIFYHGSKMFVEVSYNHTGKMPISFDTNNAVNDQWWAGYGVIDAQIRYSIDKHVDFRLQLKNIQDSTTQKVYGPGQAYNLATIQDGRAYYVGVAFHY